MRFSEEMVSQSICLSFPAKLYRKMQQHTLIQEIGCNNRPQMALKKLVQLSKVFLIAYLCSTLKKKQIDAVKVA